VPHDDLESAPSGPSVIDLGAEAPDISIQGADVTTADVGTLDLPPQARGHPGRLPARGRRWELAAELWHHALYM